MCSTVHGIAWHGMDTHYRCLYDAHRFNPILLIVSYICRYKCYGRSMQTLVLVFVYIFIHLIYALHSKYTLAQFNYHFPCTILMLKMSEGNGLCRFYYKTTHAHNANHANTYAINYISLSICILHMI